jgi:hypothetical protein
MSEEGLSPSESGAGREPPKSLGGKLLPPGWPSIAPKSHLDEAYRTFKRGEDLMVDKYSYDLSHGDKRLRYLAVEHSRDPNHPQFKHIKEKFAEFKPQVVLFEGQARNYFTVRSEKEAVEANEEVGLLSYLVDQHNAALQPGEEPIKIISGDIPDDVWISEFQKLGYSNEDIAVFNLARSIYGEVIRIDRNTSISETDKTAARREAEARFRKDPVSFIDPGLPRSNGRKWKSKHLAAAVRRLTGQDISLDIDYTRHPDLREMFNAESVFRDVYQVKKIEEAVRGNDRVFAMMGSAHPIRQEGALRQLFDEAKL